MYKITSLYLFVLSPKESILYGVNENYVPKSFQELLWRIQSVGLYESPPFRAG